MAFQIFIPVKVKDNIHKQTFIKLGVSKRQYEGLSPFCRVEGLNLYVEVELSKVTPELNIYPGLEKMIGRHFNVIQSAIEDLNRPSNGTIRVYVADPLNGHSYMMDEYPGKSVLFTESPPLKDNAEITQLKQEVKEIDDKLHILNEKIDNLYNTIKP